MIRIQEHVAEIEFGDLSLPEQPVDIQYVGDALPVPIIDHPDARILREVERMPDRWDMNLWNSVSKSARPERSEICQSAHCMAGWLVHICGVQGYRLLNACSRDYDQAASLIYQASCPGKPIPCFNYSHGNPTAYNAHHFELLRQRAAADPLPPE